MDARSTNPWHTGSKHWRLPVNLVRHYLKSNTATNDNRSNKKFKSTIHRVANLSGKERYSVPFFFGVDYDTTVSVLPHLVSGNAPACAAPFKAGDVSGP